MRRGFPRPAWLLVCLCSVGTGCRPDIQQPDIAPQFGKGANATLTVSSHSPSFAHQGDANLDVTINGTGFGDGTGASWERNGVADPGITVHATRYVSSTQLVATISVSPDAALALYDVAVVTRERKKGISTESFEITQAVVVPDMTVGLAANDAGAIVGNNATNAVFYSAVTGTLRLDGSVAWGVDSSSTRVAGYQTVALGRSASTSYAVVWERSGNSFGAGARLPIASTSKKSWARAMSPDGSWIGGSEFVAGAKANSMVEMPVTWHRENGVWVRRIMPLPAGTYRGFVADITDSGVVVGQTTPDASLGRATVWRPDGNGNWVPTVLAAIQSTARAINANADMIVGPAALSSGGMTAAYWTRNAVTGEWSSPNRLASDCEAAVGIAENGVIVARNCASGTRSGVSYMFVSFADRIELHGMGTKNSSSDVQAVAPGGRLIVGQANGATGAKWEF